VTHKPKTAALEALAADVLSEEGTRRIRRHLADCEVCRTHFAAIHVYRESQETIATTTPAVQWSKMEMALAREARAQAAVAKRPPSRAMPWLVGGAIALAAAAVAAVVLPRMLPSAPPSVPTPIAQIDRQPEPTTDEVPPTPETPTPTYASGVVSMVAGGATFLSAAEGATAAAVSVGERIANGTLTTDALAQAHLVLERAEPAAPDGAQARVARVAVGPSSRLEIGETHVASSDEGTLHELRARLDEGRMTVDAFEVGSRVVVLAGSYRVEIRAARCTIDLTRAPDGTARVSVAAADPRVGHVVVVETDGARHDLAAPEARRVWSSDGEPAQLEDLPLASLDGALVQLSYPGAVRFEIDGQVIEGGPTLAMRVHPGLIALRAVDGSGRVVRAEVSVGPDGLALAPEELQPVRARMQGYLPPEEITPIVRQSQRALQRCYEQALRLHPDLGGGLLRARVTLDSQGVVRVVELDRDGAPESLEACVRQEAARWVFPSPGGPMSFELPLRFHSTPQ